MNATKLGEQPQLPNMLGLAAFWLAVTGEANAGVVVESDQSNSLPSLSRVFIAVATCLTFVGTAQADALFQTLHSFGYAPPIGSLIQASDGNFYGTIPSGGAYGFSAVFRLTTNGAFSLVYSLTNSSDGNWPGALVQAGDGNLYGTTPLGGVSGSGSIFRLTTDGRFSTVHSFTGDAYGSIPSDQLVPGTDGALYGFSRGAGLGGSGNTLFRISTNGILTTLYVFPGPDGSTIVSGLIAAQDGYIYGTTPDGGGIGTVFQLSTNGTLATIYTFTGGADSSSPVGPLVQGIDGALYGTTPMIIGGGALSSYGTVFRVTPAGDFQTLYSFSGGSDGGILIGGLARGGDGNLYGLTQYGGANGNGTAFRLTLQGALTTIFNFPSTSNGDTSNVWDASIDPHPGLTETSDGNVYGISPVGGGQNHGMVFRVDTSNSLLAPFYSFDSVGAGATPFTSVIQASDSSVYGTTSGYGNSTEGTVFRITADGALTTLKSYSNSGLGVSFGNLIRGNDGFLYGTTGSATDYTNGVAYYTQYGTILRIATDGALTTVYDFTGGSDGVGASSALVQGRDGNLYGTTAVAWDTTSTGSTLYGTIFRLTTNGVLSTLYSFTGGTGGSGPLGNLVQGSDGNVYGTSLGAFDQTDQTNLLVFKVAPSGMFTILATLPGEYPYESQFGASGGLMQTSDGNLYLTTFSGGNSNAGAIFRITTNGTVATLYSFTDEADGSHPGAPLVQASDGTLYGTTAGDWGWGSITYGTVFQVTTNGVLTTLHSFSGGHYYGGNGGSNPYGGLIQGADGNLYDTTAWGGALDLGTVFRIVLTPPVLRFSLISPDAFHLSFQTATGQSYTILQSADLVRSNWAPYTNIIGDGSVFQLAMPINTSPARYFRLRQP